jgi:hypothetical protein
MGWETEHTREEEGEGCGGMGGEMPFTDVVFFTKDDGSVPVLEWLDELPEKARDKLIVRVERLAERGHELGRPEAALLREGVHELRARHGNVNYRLLYFFSGGRAVLSNGTTKERRVPARDINLAIGQRADFEGNPEAHTHQGEGYGEESNEYRTEEGADEEERRG